MTIQYIASRKQK